MALLSLSHEEIVTTTTHPHVPDPDDMPTDEMVCLQKTIPQHIDNHGSKLEDQAGTGEYDALGG